MLQGFSGKITASILMVLLLLTSPGVVEAGLLSSGVKMAREGVKALKRQFPSGTERALLKSGVRIKFQGLEVIKRNNTFDPGLRDALGRTNRQRMAQGRAPIGRDGVEVQLHHHQQRAKGPIIEMTATEHRQLSQELHRYTRNSEIDRQTFNRWKQDYWRSRTRDF